MTDLNVKTIASQMSISRQLLQHAGAVQGAVDDAILDSLLHPPTGAEIAAKRSERETKWDEKTAIGMVGIVDEGDFEGGPCWRRVERGDYCHRWTTGDAWTRYEAARKAYYEAEEAL